MSQNPTQNWNNLLRQHLEVIDKGAYNPQVTIDSSEGNTTEEPNKHAFANRETIIEKNRFQNTKEPSPGTSSLVRLRLQHKPEITPARTSILQPKIGYRRQEVDDDRPRTLKPTATFAKTTKLPNEPRVSSGTREAAKGTIETGEDYQKKDVELTKWATFGVSGSPATTDKYKGSINGWLSPPQRIKIENPGTFRDEKIRHKEEIKQALDELKPKFEIGEVVISGRKPIVWDNAGVMADNGNHQIKTDALASKDVIKLDNDQKKDVLPNGEGKPMTSANYNIPETTGSDDESNITINNVIPTMSNPINTSGVFKAENDNKADPLRENGPDEEALHEAITMAEKTEVGTGLVDANGVVQTDGSAKVPLAESTPKSPGTVQTPEETISKSPKFEITGIQPAEVAAEPVAPIVASAEKEEGAIIAPEASISAPETEIEEVALPHQPELATTKPEQMAVAPTTATTAVPMPTTSIESQTIQITEDPDGSNAKYKNLGSTGSKPSGGFWTNLFHRDPKEEDISRASRNPTNSSSADFTNLGHKTEEEVIVSEEN